MPEEQMKHFFRIGSYADFCTPPLCLKISSSVFGGNGTTAFAEFALAVVLRSLAYPNRCGDFMSLLEQDKTQLSRIFSFAPLI